MTKIRITRDPKYAPCGYLVMRAPFDKYDEKNTILIQSDWDFPGVAQTFGWSLSRRQQPKAKERCEHSGTDGTVTCPDCGLTPDMFISAAMAFLDDVDSDFEVEDPGYFTESD